MSPLAITSPVERISGPRSAAFANRSSGKTASFAQARIGVARAGRSSSSSVAPSSSRQAWSTSGIPVAFAPLRNAYDAFFAATQELVTGDVRLSLQPGAAVVTGRRSEHALYSESLASYGIGETFPHDAAEGFIGITALETELVAARKRIRTSIR